MHEFELGDLIERLTSDEPLFAHEIIGTRWQCRMRTLRLRLRRYWSRALYGRRRVPA